MFSFSLLPSLLSIQILFNKHALCTCSLPGTLLDSGGIWGETDVDLGLDLVMEQGRQGLHSLHKQ